ncbi:ATP-binding protein [Megamonas hypermegale]|uniref:ATP-binding protein n=1 Tax=Megamonas hypermegale TaxID=158847 RepID=UPI0025A4C5E0|nr:ATP-binding protein [Megamonas hypermegale]MDM8144244.1 ATP-binding protein [Megamonas hypermegale]
MNELTKYQQQELQQNFNKSMRVVDDIVLKNYLTELHNFEIVSISRELQTENLSDNVRLFKITQMVYEKDEFSLYKFATVFNALANSKCSVFVMMNSDGVKTDFYMGVRSLDPDKTVAFLKQTLENALKGQFPGIITEDYLEDDIEDLFKTVKADNISSVSCVANNKLSNNQDNRSFIQGLEKLALAMQGEKYTAIILATSTTQEQLIKVRKSYEEIYSNLAPLAKQQMSYSTNMSVNVSASFSESQSSSSSKSFSRSSSTSKSHSESTTKGESDTSSSSSISGIIGRAAGAAGNAAKFGSIALGSMTAPALLVGGMVLEMFSSTESKTVSSSTSKTDSTSYTSGTSYGTSSSTSSGTSKSNTQGSSQGNGMSQTFTIENKSISNLLEKINLQLKRLQEFESNGMWECAAYFMSEKQYTAEIAASTYKAIMNGNNSGVEVGTINSWKSYDEGNKLKTLKKYILNMRHPVFFYNTQADGILVSPCSYVSGNELAIHMGLPRKSVCGFPVIEHADFGKQVENYSHEKSRETIDLGRVYNMGTECLNSVKLDRNSLAMHMFITGSTGSGKSNTVYAILDELKLYGIKFLVIEPAKGEYKNVFGNDKDVRVFGTNPYYADLLKINPFKFPKGVHVFEHVDRLVEIFNVCWPMYAAMPAVLKEAVLNAYKICGWNLETSQNSKGEYYPNFKDVLEQLINVIDNSAYDKEVKSNYKGSLETRIKSLTNGLNGQIFVDDEIPSNILFDTNVIVDLSRIGSLETKSLIMGILVMRLNEYRMVNAKGMNEKLKHVTVLEEAHNILKRTSTQQDAEGSNMMGKSVEMLANTIAEIRTYGEGFIIADQSPNAVDMAAIRNTNTKIIMRLPDEADRKLAGKSAGLKENQLDEIAKLPKGVAVIYQNDWLEPVLCKIKKCNKKEKPFVYNNANVLGNEQKKTEVFKMSILKLLLARDKKYVISINMKEAEKLLALSSFSTRNKIYIKDIITEYTTKHTLSIWKDEMFDRLSALVVDIIDCKKEAMELSGKVRSTSEFSHEMDNLLALYIPDDIYTGLRIEIKKCLAYVVSRNIKATEKIKEDLYTDLVEDINKQR